MRTHGAAPQAAYWTMHYVLIALYVVVALFPLFWLLKVSVTPNDLLYTEGVRLWPSRTTLRPLCLGDPAFGLPDLLPQQRHRLDAAPRS